MIGVPVTKCRVCGNENLVTVCDLGALALSGVFPASNDPPVPEGPLEVVKCHQEKRKCCGLVQLRHSFDQRLLFGRGYGYRSGLNISMRRHLQDVAGMVRNCIELRRGDIIIDIGSNDGTFLNCFSAREFLLVGIDPTINQFRRYYSRGIRLIPDFFSDGPVKRIIGKRKAAVITALAVLYDSNEPMDFLEKVRGLLSLRGICILELGYLPLLLANNAYDTICHEHAAYYALKQLRWMAEKAGLKILRCELNGINGGSFCVVLADKKSAFSVDRCGIEALSAREERMRLDTMPPYLDFQKRVFSHRAALKRVIKGLCSDGRRIAGYGASTKGNVLLQFCGLSSDEIPFVADVNGEKWGRFCPGTGIPIVSEKKARMARPDVFLVLPWAFKDTFLVREKAFLRKGGAFLLSLPRVEMIRMTESGYQSQWLSV